MALDPALKTMLDQLAEAGNPPINELSPDEARAAMRLIVALDGEPEAMASIDDRTIPGPAGPIPIRVYQPETGASPRPLLVWLHGGGWVIGDLDTADPTCRKLANRTGALVVSVGYRLAPEHPYPAAVDDAWAALEWVAAHGAELGGDPSRLAVGGDSAGGNLAAVLSQKARDAGGLELALQLLVYPVTDLTMSHPSIEENGDGYMLTRDAMVWFIDNYLAGAEPKQPLASPLFADDLSGLAPACVLTAEFDPLRDEGEAYAARLTDAGVATEVRRFDGMIHGFFGMGTVTPIAGEAVDYATAALRRALA